MFIHFNPSNQQAQSLNQASGKLHRVPSLWLLSNLHQPPVCQVSFRKGQSFEANVRNSQRGKDNPWGRAAEVLTLHPTLKRNDLLFLVKTCFLSTISTLTFCSWMLCKSFFCASCVFWFSGVPLFTSMEIPLENGRAHRASRQSDLPMSSNTSLSTVPVAGLIFCIVLADEKCLLVIKQCIWHMYCMKKWIVLLHIWHIIWKNEYLFVLHLYQTNKCEHLLLLLLWYHRCYQYCHPTVCVFLKHFFHTWKNETQNSKSIM